MVAEVCATSSWQIGQLAGMKARPVVVGAGDGGGGAGGCPW